MADGYEGDVTVEQSINNIEILLAGDAKDVLNPPRFLDIAQRAGRRWS